MRSEVEIVPGARRDAAASEVGSSGAATPAAIGHEELKEVLRPIVMELFEEELDLYRRMRG